MRWRQQRGARNGLHQHKSDLPTECGYAESMITAFVPQGKIPANVEGIWWTGRA
jgi:hypothetical protein